MKALEANSKWLLLAVFYALINDSLNCTFRTVTDNFSASLKGIYNVTTEQECLSKCSIDPECTFLTYYEGRCEIFEDGDDIQDPASVSKAFSYSFEGQETSCPTAVVSRPRSSTMKLSTTPDSLSKINITCGDYHRNYSGYVIVTKKNLMKTPDKIVPCKFAFVPDECKCTRKTLKFDDNWRMVVTDYVPYTGTVCVNYKKVEAPNAFAEYMCTETGYYIYVVDTESGKNPQFPDFVGLGLERVKTSPIFYMGKG